MKFQRHFFVTMLAGLAVFVVAFATTVTGATSESLRPPSPETIHLADEHFEGWQYSADREDRNVIVQIMLDDTSLAGLEAFRGVNQQMAHDLIKQQGSLAVTVILDQPLSATEATDLAARYGLKVKSFQMRVIDGRGERITLFGGSDINRFISGPELQSMLDRIQADTGEAKLLGVTTVDTELSVSNYYNLLADPAVFLVDVTPTVAQQHMKQHHASLLQADDLVTVSAYPVYWYLESSQQSAP